MTAVWAGIDSGKRAHHCAVIDAAVRMVLSRRVANDESALLELITSVLALAVQDGGGARPPGSSITPLQASQEPHHGQLHAERS